MKKSIIIGSVAVLFLFIAVAVASFDPENTDLNQDNTVATSSDPEEDGDNAINETTENSTTSGIYIDYSESAFAETNPDENIVIFFHAVWCPTCRSLDDDIVNNSSNIPSNTTILKADFDEHRSLRQKYGITRQHALIQVDSSGQEINTWYLSRTLEEVLVEIN